MIRAARAPAFVLAALATAASLGARPSSGEPRSPSIEDYRRFRAVSIDLLGRMPTRDELAAVEQPGFELDAWIDAHLSGDAYVARLVRPWMDALRLEAGSAVQYAPDASTLYRHAILGPDGKSTWVYYRAHERRELPAIDGEFCFSFAEVGVHTREQPVPGETPRAVSQELLDARTVLVRPWWLYRDAKEPAPAARIFEAWKPDVAFRPVDTLLTEPDGTPARAIRVCREEAETREAGHVWVTGRDAAPKGQAPPFDRRKPLPADSAWAKEHRGELIRCRSRLALESSKECGCGPALERCVPADGDVGQPRAFHAPDAAPLGLDAPLDFPKQAVGRWFPRWWAEEARRFLGRLFAEDRDLREMVTARWTLVNGPLAQFYRFVQPGNCCGPEVAFGMTEELDPLFVPDRAPELAPSDTSAWRVVDDRGPRAAGLLTTPIFLEKYASARARGAAVWSALLCKQLVADDLALHPSDEPDLTKREGCRACHATLEPLAASFSRVEPGNLVFLPEGRFPVRADACKKRKNGTVPGFCGAFYDPAFTDDQAGTLRGAYAGHERANASVSGIGAEIARSPDFAACIAKRTLASFLGRPTDADDAALESELTRVLVTSGYRPRALVRAILRSRAYRDANDRAAGGAP